MGAMLPWTQVGVGAVRTGYRLLHCAAADARQIAVWRAAGYSVTRRNCEGYGMSRRRWVWAVGLLKLARILGDQVGSADSFLIEDVEECAQAIDWAVRAVEARGMQSLILRLPKGARGCRGRRQGDE